MKLTNKVALVTGGARGIGHGIAQRFVAEGCRVMIGDVLEERLAETVAELGDNAACCLADVSRPADARHLVDEAVARFGRLDICVNNAAIARDALLLELSEEDFDAVLGVNVKGAFLVGQAAARQMVAQRRGGAIINLASVNTLLAIPNQTAYTVSKGAIHQLTRSMAVQLARFGIRANAIGPGLIDNQPELKVWSKNPEGFESFMARTPLGRAGRPDEIAAVAAFLASDDASYVSGETIYADGGRLPLNLTLGPGERGPASDDRL